MKRCCKTVLALLIVLALVLPTAGCKKPSPEEKLPEMTCSAEDAAISIAMLNYLTVTTQEVAAATNSRLYLEEIYSSVVNHINPEAVRDAETKQFLTDLLNAITDFQLGAAKREQLDLLCEEEKANVVSAITGTVRRYLQEQGGGDVKEGAVNAVKNAIGDTKGFIKGAVMYAVSDLTETVLNAGYAKSPEYLKAQWELDNSELETLQNLRTKAFNYMIAIAQKYNIPGNMTLNEEAAKDLAAWENEPNNTRKIELLEGSESRLACYGNYWLILSEAYFEEGEYRKCLAAFDRYDAIGVSIFRQDFAMARTLPAVIASMEKTLPAEEYLAKAPDALERMLANSDEDDWALRYYAAQTYTNLYDRTGDRAKLERAYAITLNNVAHLAVTQRELNDAYLNDVDETVIKVAEKAKRDKDADKAEASRELRLTKQFVRQLKIKRRTELAPVYEPLTVCCDLLFTLADIMELSPEQQAYASRVLRSNGEPLFLSEPLEALYSFEKGSDDTDYVSMSFSKNQLTMNANCVSENSVIKVFATDPDGVTVTFDDWKIKKVERDGKSISDFTVTLTSKSALKEQLGSDAVITVEVYDASGDARPALTVEFDVSRIRHFIWNFIEYAMGKVEGRK